MLAQLTIVKTAIFSLNLKARRFFWLSKLENLQESGFFRSNSKLELQAWSWWPTGYPGWLVSSLCQRISKNSNNAFKEPVRFWTIYHPVRINSLKNWISNLKIWSFKFETVRSSNSSTATDIQRFQFQNSATQCDPHCDLQCDSQCDPYCDSQQIKPNKQNKANCHFERY